jgi:nucleoside-diphosphate-sugar epimerase
VYAIALAETDINFSKMGQPDMTYGWSKLTGEFLAQIAARNYGISVACVRPFSGYGEDQDLSYPTPAIAARAARKENPFEVWGSGYQGRDFVHIDDLVAGVLSTYQTLNWNTPLNISSGVGTSFYQLAELILLAIGKEAIPIATEKNMPEGVFARVGNRNLQERYGLTLQTSLSEGVMRTLSFLDR